MVLKLSSSYPEALSPSHRDEKEISDEDDDRNHKHRRRDTRSQSLERDASEQVLTRPFRKRNTPFENGHSFKESNSHSSGTWKNFNTSYDKDSPLKFEKRRARASFDQNQRMRLNQSFSGDHCPGRGRGRESGTWNQCDSRFGSVDIASQMIHQGSAPPNLFTGMGYPNVSSSKSASWGTFGLIPGIQNGGLGTRHPLGLQGALRPPINPSLNIGIPHQRCRDFEELGFCLRGNICPMEHGVNRIVVDDVQGLSQFDLPVLGPNAHLMGMGAAPGPGTLQSTNATTSTLMNSKRSHNKSSMHDTTKDGFGLNGSFYGSAGANVVDLYDPDQPLWNDFPETSTGHLAPHSPKIDDIEPVLDADQRNISLPVWGKTHGPTKTVIELKNNLESTMGVINFPKSETIIQDIGSKFTDFSSRAPVDSRRSIRKPSQRAQRTLFVNAVPQNINRREVILSHFRKFGKIINIYIPPNSDHAFVQFSKSEEAETALMAPDAVMGNRFIKLWWAKRDHIPDGRVRNENGLSVTSCGIANVSDSTPSVVSKTDIDGTQSADPKINITHASDASGSSSDHSKHVGTDSLKVVPSQKKLENLEVLKEQLRKKQEMLDQKRNNFRRQLDNLTKATGAKCEVAAEQAAKKQKIDFLKEKSPALTDSGTQLGLEKSKSGEIGASKSPQNPSNRTMQESTYSKLQIRPFHSTGSLFPTNRFKLDNRPTVFRIIPPLPTGFSDVSVIRDHFALYSDLSTVTIDDAESNDGIETDFFKNCSARVSFATRRSAEMAFVNGKSWQGQTMKFTWLTSSNANNESVGTQRPTASLSIPSDAALQPVEKVECIVAKVAAKLGNRESENSERKHSSMAHIQQDNKCHYSSNQIECENPSPKGDVR